MIPSKLAAKFRRAGTGPTPSGDSAPAAAPASAETEITTTETAAPTCEAVAASLPPQISPTAAAETHPTRDGAGRISRLVEPERAPKAASSSFNTAALADRVIASIKAASGRPAAIPAAAAAALALSLGIGYALGSAGGERSEGTSLRLTQASMDLRRTDGEIAQLAADLKGMKSSLDALKGERDRTRGEILSRQASLADKIERSSQDHATRFTRLSDQLDRLEKAGKDPSRLQAMTDKLERIDRTVAALPAAPAPAAAPTPPPKPVAAAAATPAPDVAQTGSLPAATKPDIDPRKTKIEGIYVRDIDDGFALIETRQGGFLEVAVGSVVPGIGRVEAIERRGRQWVVTTAKGFIAER